MIFSISSLCIALLLFCIYYRGICVRQNRMIDSYAKRLGRAEENEKRIAKALSNTRKAITESYVQTTIY